MPLPRNASSIISGVRCDVVSFKPLTLILFKLHYLKVATLFVVPRAPVPYVVAVSFRLRSRPERGLTGGGHEEDFVKAAVASFFFFSLRREGGERLSQEKKISPEREKRASRDGEEEELLLFRFFFSSSHLLSK